MEEAKLRGELLRMEQTLVEVRVPPTLTSIPLFFLKPASSPIPLIFPSPSTATTPSSIHTTCHTDLGYF
jgi:hypothetical protein